MIRRLTDKVSPDVIVESVVKYELPADYADLLNGIDQIDEAYRDSVFAGIRQHLEKEFAADGFFPEDLIYA